MTWIGCKWRRPRFFLTWQCEVAVSGIRLHSARDRARPPLAPRAPFICYAHLSYVGISLWHLWQCLCFCNDKSKSWLIITSKAKNLSWKYFFISKGNLWFYSCQNTSKWIQKPEDAKVCVILLLVDFFKLFYKIFIFSYITTMYLYFLLSFYFFNMFYWF